LVVFRFFTTVDFARISPEEGQTGTSTNDS